MWSLNCDTLIAKCNEIKTKKMMLKINKVVVGITAPIKAVSFTRRSYQTARTKTTTPVKSHIHENSSLNFLFLTRDMMTTKIVKLIISAKTF